MNLDPLGPVVHDREVRAEELLAGCPVDRYPLVLTPSSARGWFDGTGLVGLDPIASATWEDDSYATVGELLDATLAGSGPPLTAAVLDYEGTGFALGYDAGLVQTPDGWRTFGNVRDVPGSPRVGGEATPPADAGSRPAEGSDAAIPADRPLVENARADMERADFERGVELIRDAVARGDVYVLNLTYRLAGAPAASPQAVFSALVGRGRSAMSAALLTPDRSVLSISPERFLAVDGRGASIEPIKGTRPRGATSDQDVALADELAASEKERAEHVMIVDLERNDLGRVSVWDTVRVDPLMEIVPTPYCHQMVSTVRSTLRDDARCADILSATFPCGSVTGAPKIAAMQHIERLERSPRGAYCGALLVATRGRLDSSVLIRTIEWSGATARYGTGGGITFDSVPREEWDETLVKALPFLGKGPLASRA